MRYYIDYHPMGCAVALLAFIVCLVILAIQTLIQWIIGFPAR